MITSKYILNLIEKYRSSGKVYGNQADIYEDPSSSDVIALTKFAREHGRVLTSVRFLADDNSKKVYVADAYIVNHDDMRRLLGMPRDFNKTPWIFEGKATVSNGSLICGIWDKYSDFVGLATGQYGKVNTEVKDWYEATINRNWNWVDNYILGFASKIVEYKNDYESKKRG